jgi:alkylhydroperoxidase family enzyme
MDIGSAVGRRTGVTEQQLQEFQDFETSSAFSPLERMVIRYAIAMSRTPADVGDAVFQELRGHLEDRQIVELTAAIALENYRARFNRAFGIQSEGFSEGAFCALPARVIS